MIFSFLSKSLEEIKRRQLVEKMVFSERIDRAIDLGNYYLKFFSGIPLFPGGVEEYRQSREYTVEIIPTGRSDGRAIIYEDESCRRIADYRENDDKKLADFLINQGIEALVDVRKYGCDKWDGGVVGRLIHCYYGLPVRRKPSAGPYR